MVEAAQTAAAPAAYWVIISVAMLCLAFWLTAVRVADKRRATLSRRQRMTDTQAGPGTQAQGRPAGAADRVEQTRTGPGSPDRDDGEYW